jgi:methionyl-tRNA synthetase
LKGEQPCYFVTGADEHGQKIANTAADQGKEPQDICDKVRERLYIVVVNVMDLAPFAYFLPILFCSMDST